MAKLKLSELPAVTSKTDSDLLYVVQNGASKQISIANLLANVVAAGNNIVVESNGMISAETTLTSTDGLPEGNVNFYFSVARTLAAVKDSINTSNVIEGSNLYFTNARAIAALTAGSGIILESNGYIDVTLESFTSDNLAEGSNKLYFSNERSIAAFTAGTGIHIDANGLITATTLGANIEGGGLDEPVTQIIDYGSL